MISIPYGTVRYSTATLQGCTQYKKVDSPPGLFYSSPDFTGCNFCSRWNLSFTDTYFPFWKVTYQS